ncbi:MAG: transglycosylase SLT domain-containing protein [Thermodesulfobacteriota bacterium]
MIWRVGIPTMVMAWLLLAAPTAAGIQRHVDSQGVIRISNSTPAPPGQSRQESPAAASAARDQEGHNSKPRVGAATSPRPQGPRPPDAIPPTPSSAPDPAPGKEQNFPAPPEYQGMANPVETGTGARTPSVKKVAFTGVEAEAAAIPGSQVQASRKPEVIKEGGIRRFRDHQGVLHVTNTPPGREDSGTRTPEAKTPGVLEKGFLAEPSGQETPVPTNLPLQKVSWSPDHPGISPLTASAATGGKPASGLENTIRIYRDSQGVIHIDNEKAGSQEPSQQQPTLARAGPEDGRAPPPESRPPPSGGAEDQVQQPGAWSGAEIPSPPTALISAPFSKPETVLPGSIRRYRDGRGVTHLETAGEASGPGGPPQLPRLDELSRKLTLASLNPGIAPAGASGNAGGAMGSVSPPVRNYGGISVLREQRGRLTISNAQPAAGVGRSQPVMEARAQLEPIIQEAARAYGLPATLIRAVIRVESNFTPRAVSPKGAMGLMQLMPGTAAFLGVQEPFNPRENILGGCRYLRLLLDFFGGSVPLALAGYNAGYQRVVNCGYRVPDIKETQEFLTQVMGWYLAEEKKALLPRI